MMKNKEILGYCKDCLWYKQEWLMVETEPMKMIVDNICSICDVFKRPDGYCDMWESNNE